MTVLTLKEVSNFLANVPGESKKVYTFNEPKITPPPLPQSERFDVD